MVAFLFYLSVGAVFALWFVIRGVARIDPNSRGSHWAFRVLIFPGAAALWPLLLAKLRRAPAAPPPEHHP